MIEIRETDEFSTWFAELKDRRARTKITARIRRLAHGNAGDVAPVGQGISEMRIHFGPGYRVYYLRRGDVLVILLCAGTKKSQAKDIERAKVLAKEQED